MAKIQTVDIFKKYEQVIIDNFSAYTTAHIILILRTYDISNFTEEKRTQF